MPTPPSPCVRNCCLNEKDICLGCGRSLQEILDWHSMSDDQKQTILAELSQRQPNGQSAESGPGALRTRRCFIGLELPDRLKYQLEQHSHSLRTRVQGNAFRWIPRQNYHMTLAFLGSLDDNSLSTLEQALGQEQWFTTPAPVEVKVLGGFPKPGKSRYLVAHVEPEPVLPELYSRLQARLGDLGLPTEQRPLRAHITLARLKRGVHPPAVEDLAAPLPGFTAERLTLFESRLSDEGASYQPLARFS